MSSSWAASLEQFADAASWFVSTTARVGDRWTHPGLGEWDVRALVGHTSRSLLTVEAYLEVPAAHVDVASTVAYYRATRTIAAGPDVVRRGREAGVALGDDPPAAVDAIAARVVSGLASRRGDEILTTVVGGMRLVDYLPTRTFELVVHTLDLAAALDLAVEPPARAAADALRVVADLAADGGLAGPLLLAATGRRGLPDGFTVL